EGGAPAGGVGGGVVEVARAERAAREAEVEPDAGARGGERWAIPEAELVEAERDGEVVERAVVGAEPAHARLDGGGDAAAAEQALAPAAGVAVAARAQAAQRALDRGDIFVGGAGMLDELPGDGGERAVLGDEEGEQLAPGEAAGGVSGIVSWGARHGFGR